MSSSQSNQDTFAINRARDSLQQAKIRVHQLRNSHPDWETQYRAIPLSPFVEEKIRGDKYGQIIFYDQSNIFLHPGLTTPSVLSFNLDRKLKNMKLTLFISKLPESCGADAGNVKFILEGDNRDILQTVVDRSNEQELEISLENIKSLKFIVDSNGSPDCDWFKVKITEEDWVTN